MPHVRKLAPEEVRDIEGKVKGQRKLVEEEYDSILQDYEISEYGEAELASDEKRITVRNRLRAAAERRGVGLEFRRTRGNLLRFKVVESADVDDDFEEAEALVQPTTITAAPKKRGPKPKQKNV